MAVRDLLVYLDSTPQSAARLQLAFDLAHRHGSRVTGLYIREWSESQLLRRRTAELAGRPMHDMQRLDAAVEAELHSIAKQLQAELQRLGRELSLPVEWRCVDGAPLEVLPQHARFTDLCLVGDDTPTDHFSAGYRFCEEMLFVTGRPVLIVPGAGSFKTLGRHLLVAWNASRPAARALNDALPLMERADQVTVLAVNSDAIAQSYGSLPPRYLVEHLKRHGISAQMLQVEQVPGAAIADTLQTKAHALGADLIVAGAYGHARIREKLLGGVTRTLLEHMQLPLMMSL